MLLTILLLFFLLCLYGADFNLAGYHGDYLSKAKTNSIKGIFIIIVVLKHALGYLNEANYGYGALGDSSFVWIICSQAQLIVVMFLFYSGYGVGESFKAKGMDYVRIFPKRRILTTLLNFDVVVVIFTALGLLLAVGEPLSNFLPALIGWESMGNSNWYIFVVLLCYLMTWVVLSLPLTRSWHRVALLFVVCFLSIVVLSIFKDEAWWYDTILTYPAGFMFSTYKEPIERFIKRHYWGVLVLLGMLFLVQFIGFYKRIYVDDLSLSFNLMSITFALLIVVLTMKIGINNKPLQWLGKNLFPIYIYMRIPMMILAEKQSGLILTYPAAFIVISLAVTLLIAHLFHYWQIKLK